MEMKRSEVAAQDRWNVEAFYPSLEMWNKDFNRLKSQVPGTVWSEIKNLKGQLKEGPAAVVKLLELYIDLDRQLTKLYVYSHLRHDEDVGSTETKEAHLKITALTHEFRQEMAWIEPELLQLPEKELSNLLEAPEAQPYRFYLEKIVRLKPHTLDEEKEALLASATLALDATERAFGSFNNADLKFPKVMDEKGELHELTHGSYMTYMASRDRTLRKETFKAMHNAYGQWENTLCELIQGEVQKHQFFAKARHFQSCLDAALFPHRIDPQVYRGLIQTVRAHLPILHNYMALRKKLLGVDELHLYDLRVPLIADVDIKMDFEEASQMIIESVAPLRDQYQSILKKGLFEERWVDRYENERKRSGAYSSGCYDSHPYILMNYQGRFQDIMTLSHEAGHSMHSYFSKKNQPYHDASYAIFVAEVASTFNEELTLMHLLKKVSDPRQRAYIINQKIEDLRNTFFRQVMFAEFELKIHECVEQGIPLTPDYLNKEYLQLNRDYFGSSVIIDDEIKHEWARIPHFYYNFYVYQYATGISAAHALVQKVLRDGPDNYLQFLSAGGSRFPLDILKSAGVDMTTSEPIIETLKLFADLTIQLEEVMIQNPKNTLIQNSNQGIELGSK
ncbi:MAG: oligoendopeptidase F [Rhabdochlamydiaceae bacterium]|nr:oligoendopeptidase F [Rhabdochlamydiaceae bacterium]